MSLPTDTAGLKAALAPYQRPSHRRSILEIAVTALPLAAFWILALLAVGRGWWWGVILTAPAAVFLVRLFMIQHDCGHASFFRSSAANAWTGRVIGVLTATPYDYWRRTHAIHHATSGNLDRRGLGAVETLTVEEYRARPWLLRAAYRLYRHPLVMFGLGPCYMFVLQHRAPIGLMREGRAWLSVLGNNLGLAVLILPQILLAGPVAFLTVHLTIVVLAASIGVWLFYLQHQFEGARWTRNDRWSLHEAALHGSSYLHLPPILRWCTANIGAHHVHHAGSKIPFYRLPQVLDDHPQLQTMSRITLGDSFKAMRLSLWDEANGRLISFREARRTVRAVQGA
ncbi:MAG TPA: fatty acid desaturase [Phenylobacterium sp.]|uniref:fatty acid desaturase n=1 Tax=Phenylobacterium sp. TaxID=1871053 RepID=UPI002B4718DF|nr:fatty acid desaturase [Phenylobacterium sp.]HKR88853.1 fatty acid desaturase [Phenylobacterium sp.]